MSQPELLTRSQRNGFQTQDNNLLFLASDAFSKAMGRVIAEKEREWNSIIQVRDSEHRAVVAELRSKIMELENEVRGFVNEQRGKVDAAISAIKNGEPGPKGEPGEKGEQGSQGEKGPQGEPGEQGPEGQKGERGEPGAQGDPGKPGEKGERGEPGLKGEPGEIGQPGPQGQAGRDGLPGVPGSQGERGIDGKDGRDGKDGIDGLGFDNWLVEYDNQRTFTFKCGSGDRLKQFAFDVPFLLDRGVWRAGVYSQGDCVSYNGSIFIAQKETSAIPKINPADWRLAVKHGRDGKDGKDGAPGPQGPQGRQGQDATQLGPNGGKW